MPPDVVTNGAAKWRAECASGLGLATVISASDSRVVVILVSAIATKLLGCVGQHAYFCKTHDANFSEQPYWRLSLYGGRCWKSGGNGQDEF